MYEEAKVTIPLSEYRDLIERVTKLEQQVKTEKNKSSYNPTVVEGVEKTIDSLSRFSSKLETLIDIAKEQNGRIFTVDSKINKLIVASETKKKSWF